MLTSKYFLAVLIFALLPVALLQPEVIEALLRRLESKQPSSSVQESAAKGVLRRLLPTHSYVFHFKIVSKDVCGGQNCFWIQNCNTSCKNGHKIMIKGTTAVDVAAGLHWYLKYWCGAHISWDKTGGIQVASVPKPGSLPLLGNRGVLIQRPVPWSYYQNVVTSSYSNAWWDWVRWEKEIDWMALQGVNLPLAFTGQEAIWKKVYMDFNITMDDLKAFFGGPAFLAWARMGNLHGWGGPLSQNWLDRQLVMQKQILARIVELGMTPVLPSFSGNVPAALKRQFPSANITRLANWNSINGDPRWCCTFLLNPSDPLFVEIGEAFLKKQVQEYGDVTDIYNCDTFNENLPPTSDPNYISLLGAAVYRAMSRGNNDAVWLMQGWLFFSDSAFWKPLQMKALLHSVPHGKMIVLDLFADVKPIWRNSSQFYGTPYVWCLLHNFGGNIEMYGILDAVSSGPVNAHTSKNSTMVGVGMCMEGIEQNPVIYELMSEMAFRNEKVQVLEWLRSYSHRRYGTIVPQIEAAWEILYHTVYNCSDGIEDHNRDFIVQFPDQNPSLNFTSGSPKPYHIQKLFEVPRHRRLLFEDASSNLLQPHLWYSTEELVRAWQLFLVSGKELAGSSTYRYDLVDLTRQVLSKLANQVYTDAVIAFQHKDLKSVTLHGQKLLQLIKDIDELLASNDNFLLGTWLESAKRMAKNIDELKQYEWNARTQVTMWFDTTKTMQSKLHDYANKYWSGLLEGYYLPRASTYFSYMVKSLKQNETFNLEGWRREWISFSNKWQSDGRAYPVRAEGDSVVISNALYKKYGRMILENQL